MVTTMASQCITSGRPVAPAFRANNTRATVAALYGSQQRSNRRFTRGAVMAQSATAEAALDVAKMAPLGDKLLVKPQAQAEKSLGGVILASASSTPSMQDAQVGTVVAVGDEVDVGVAAGDRVLFSKYGSSDVEGPDGPVSFVAQKSILAKLS